MGHCEVKIYYMTFLPYDLDVEQNLNLQRHQSSSHPR